MKANVIKFWNVTIVSLLLLFSSNAFTQIWSTPSHPVVSGLPPGNQIIEIKNIMLHSSGKLWCFFVAKDTLAFTWYIAPYDSKKSEWIDPIRIPEELVPYIFELGEIVEDKKGYIWIIGEYFGSYYDGSSWSELIEIPPPFYGHPSICCRDSVGNIWMVWHTSSVEYWELCYNWYDGENWSDGDMLTNYSRPYECLETSLIADKYGKVWVAWTAVGGLSPKPLDGSYLKCYGLKGWGDSTYVPDPDSGAFMPKLASDSRGRIWAVWLSWPTCRDGDTAAIYVGYYENGEWSIPTFICKEVTKSYPVNPVYFFPRPTITVDKKNKVWVAWNSTHSDSLGDIWFVYFDGNEWSKPAPVYARPGVDWPPSLIVDREGRVWCWWSVAGNYIATYICHTLETGIEEQKRNNPIQTLILNNFPNPFISSTTIWFYIPKFSYTTLKIYNSTGELIRTLINDKVQAGSHSMVWDGRDNNDRKVASSIYFCQLQTEGFTTVNRMVLLK